MMEKSLSDIRENVYTVSERLREAAIACGRNPDEIRIMAVTKRNDAMRVNAAIEAGIKNHANQFAGQEDVQPVIYAAQKTGYQRRDNKIHNFLF